jgi:superfamily II DNA/RNA helicase
MGCSKLGSFQTLRQFQSSAAALRITRRLPPPSPTSVTVRAISKEDADAAAAILPGFDELGLSAECLAAVEEKSLTQPTEIQAVAIPSLLRDRKSDFIIASHTGSGKTLAYLLPIVHMLKEHETVFGIPSKPRRPRALVLGPTRELAEQIHAVAKSLAHAAKFRAICATGAGDFPAQKAALDRPLDLLVATPARVAQHADKGSLYYGDVDVVVLDEADTMLDRGFGPEVESILKAVRSKPTPARFILVSATMTKQVRKLLVDNFPAIRTVETSSLHKGVVGARHVFLPVPSGVDKLDLAVQVVNGEVQRGKRVLLFANTLDSCRAAEHHLRESGIPTVCYHGDVPLAERKDAIKQFADPEANPPPVLVATDLAARGLDIPGSVDHVVNFDFPLNSIDYLHRTGRTARAGQTGKITSLVTRNDKVLADRVEDALAKGLSLDGMSSDRAVLPPHMRPKPETLARRAAERKAEKHQRSSYGGGRGGGRGGRGGGRGGRGGRGGGRGRGSSSSSSSTNGGGGRFSSEGRGDGIYSSDFGSGSSNSRRGSFSSGGRGGGGRGGGGRGGGRTYSKSKY